MLAGELKNLKLVRLSVIGEETDEVDLFARIGDRPAGVLEGNDLRSLVFKGTSEAFLTMPGAQVRRISQKNKKAKK